MSHHYGQDYTSARNPFLNDNGPINSSSPNYGDQEEGRYPTQPVDLRYTETVALDDGIQQDGNQTRNKIPFQPGESDLVQEILNDKNLLMSKGFYFFFFAAFGSLFPLMGIYFKQMGMNPVQSGVLTGVRPFVEIFSAPFWVRFADRFNRGKLLLMGSMFSWIIFTTATAYIRPPTAACVTFNSTHYILYTPYLDENDEKFEKSVGERSKRSSLADTPTIELLESSTNDSISDTRILENFGSNLTRNQRNKRASSSRSKKYKPPPTHVIGKSPIPIDYTLNFNKDIHASYVSPPFSSLVYKWEDVETVFLLLMLLTLIGELFSAPAITLADTVTLEYLGDNIDNYGRQRMFGSAGWAISMFFVGMALDSSTSFKNHPCGPHESERNYKVCFTIFAILMILASAIAYQFKFPENPSSTFVSLADDVPMKKLQETGPKSIFNTAAPINPPPGMNRERKFEFLDKWKSAVFAQRTREMPEWVEVLKTFNNIRYGAFLFVVWFMGAGIGLAFTFLFWHLQDLGGTPTLFGIASVINHVSEILAYFYSLQFIKEYGHTRVLCFGLLCNVARFLYIAWMDNPWLVLPFEFAQGITHAGVWAACCSYITQATPAHLKSSTQGVLQGLHHGFGRGSGAILAGIFIDKFGTKPVFALYGLLSALVLAFFLFVNTQKTDKGRFQWFEDEAEHNVYIDESGGTLAPHGVPSAPITKTASRTNLTDSSFMRSTPANADMASNSQAYPLKNEPGMNDFLHTHDWPISQ